jgi:mannosyl-3-phosphoglycerate phosphatase
MIVIVSDLDGTLLDHHTYSFAAARPALEALRKGGIPLVFSTSKTRAEVEFWRGRMGVKHPFIVENGGALYLPRGYFSSKPAKAVKRGEYDVIEFGDSYASLVETLEGAAHDSGCRVLGFHDMTVAEVSIRTRLPIRQAELAKQREYDEAFEILDSGTHRLLREIELRGKRWTRGGRFYHITGDNDKAVAVSRLAELYRKAHGEVEIMGLGDGWNDVEFLKVTDCPVIIRSELADEIRKAVPRSVVTTEPGNGGWNEAVLKAISSSRLAGSAVS